MDPKILQQALTAPSFAHVRRRVFRQMLESLLYEGVLPDLAGTPYSCVSRRRYTFDRLTVSHVERDGTEPTSITRFLDEVAHRLDAAPVLLARFARELEETLIKDALAQHQRHDVDLATADLDTLESAISDGHRYHPAYKSRIGFDLADNLRYGPEFARPVRPLWLAVHGELAEVTASSTIDVDGFLAAQLGEAFGPLPEGMTVLPVHPWQWREHVARAFAEQLRGGELVVLGEDPDSFRAQQSIRTLSCVDDEERPYLKLAMSLVNTSTSRVLAPHTVHNAPLITDWLRRIVEGDAFLRDEARAVLLGEVLGTSVVPSESCALSQEDHYGTLASIWRENLRPFLDAGELTMPFTGFTSRRLDGTPLIDGWVREHGLRPWVKRLAEVAVLPLMHLLCQHGIALEAHAQNVLLLHRDGWPTRIALRDFHDGVRFSPTHLAAPGLRPPLRGTPPHHQNRNSFVETDDPELVADFLLDAFLFVNIGELAMFLADGYGLDEREFWTILREVCEAHLERFPDPLFDIFKPVVAVEKLTTRRLLPDTELRLRPAPNPLATQDTPRH